MCDHPYIFLESCLSGVSMIFTLSHFNGCDLTYVYRHHHNVHGICQVLSDLVWPQDIARPLRGWVGTWYHLRNLDVLSPARVSKTPELCVCGHISGRCVRRGKRMLIASGFIAGAANLGCQVTCVCDFTPVRPVWLCRLAMVSFQSPSSVPLISQINR